MAAPYLAGVLGRALTVSEHDENVDTIYDRVEVVEALVAALSPGNNIVEVTYTNASFTLHFDDYSEHVVPLPIATFVPRGPWVAFAPYSYPDLVTVNGVGAFLVLRSHTSAATFDPEAVNVDDEPLYSMVMPWPDMNGLLRYTGDFAGSTEYEVDDAFTDPTYGLFIVLTAHTSESTFDPFAEDSDGPLYKRLAPAPHAAPENISATDHAITVADSGKYLRMLNGGYVTFTSGLAFELGAEVHIRQAGNTPVVFLEGDFVVTINPQRAGYDTSTTYRGCTITAKYVATDTWDLIGPYGAATDVDEYT